MGMSTEESVDPRTEGPVVGDERSVLLGFLSWQRQTLEMKCAGLDAAEMARRGVEPSAMSLLGLVRHMAEVERFWFRETMSGLDVPQLFCSESDRDGDFDNVEPTDECVAEAWDAWRAEVAFSDQFVAAAPDLDVTGNERWRGAMSLRWVLIHIVEEYARHNGHADLLRERIDGAVGE